MLFLLVLNTLRALRGISSFCSLSNVRSFGDLSLSDVNGR